MRSESTSPVGAPPTPFRSAPQVRGRAGTRATATRPTATELWNEAHALLDRDAGGLAGSIPRAARGGFTGGAAWMARALEVSERSEAMAADPDGSTPTPPALPPPGANAGEADPTLTGFVRLGLTKYGLALIGGALPTGWAITLFRSGWANDPTLGHDPGAFVMALAHLAIALECLAFLLVPFAIGFYAVESRFVFAFPLALDGSRHPLRDSNRLVVRNGRAQAFATVVAIATRMVVGSPRGLARRWATGCLAVVLWYVRVREATSTRTSSR